MHFSGTARGLRSHFGHKKTGPATRGLPQSNTMAGNRLFRKNETTKRASSKMTLLNHMAGLYSHHAFVCDHPCPAQPLGRLAPSWREGVRMLAFILGILGFGSMAAAGGGGRSKDAIIKAVVKAKEQAEEAAPEAPEVVDPEPEEPKWWSIRRRTCPRCHAGSRTRGTGAPRGRGCARSGARSARGGGSPRARGGPEAPEVVVTIPEAPEQPSGGPEPTPTPAGVTLDASFNASAISGRVTTLELPEGDIASVKVISGPQYGNVTVNPDNTLAVVLSGTTQTADINFTIETTSSTGAVTNHEVNLDVSAGLQESGWGLGQHYMLETDENDDVVVEHGENHRKVSSPAAMMLFQKQILRP